MWGVRRGPSKLISLESLLTAKSRVFKLELLQYCVRWEECLFLLSSSWLLPGPVAKGTRTRSLQRRLHWNHHWRPTLLETPDLPMHGTHLAKGHDVEDMCDMTKGGAFLRKFCNKFHHWSLPPLCWMYFSSGTNCFWIYSCKLGDWSWSFA